MFGLLFKSLLFKIGQVILMGRLSASKNQS
jgi:hypothetical protein